MTMEVSAIARRGSLLVAALMCVAAVANAQSVPAPWTAADIGGPVLSGSAAHDAGVFTISGAGSDVGGASDQFLFVYRQLSAASPSRADCPQSSHHQSIAARCAESAHRAARDSADVLG